jgi:hypothetical protein
MVIGSGRAQLPQPMPPFWQVSFWTTRRAGAFDQQCRPF